MTTAWWARQTSRGCSRTGGLARTEKGSTRAPWAQLGQATAWTAFLADENDNAYSGWFNDLGSTITGAGNPRIATAANGGAEGTVDRAAYLTSVLKLATQVSAGMNANTALDAMESLTVQSGAITVPSSGSAAGTCCPGYLNALLEIGARHVPCSAKH